MPVDFHLSASEAAVREAAAGLAQHVLAPARAVYSGHADQESRFQATRPAYAVAVAGGAVRGMVVPALGGAGGSIVETAILVEECYAVEPSTALTIFSTGLGLMPFNLLGDALPERCRRFLEPFLKDDNKTGTSEGQPHAPLASLVFSEPGGVANFLERGAPGLHTTARRSGDDWVINGEKLWATNSAGWDFKGADIACVVCRDVTGIQSLSSDGNGRDTTDPRDDIMIIVVSRADLDRNGPDSFQVIRHVPTMGHTSVSGPHIRYTDVRVPATNVLVTGQDAVRVLFGAFDWTAVLVGAQAVGLMRAAFEAALAFAKTDDRRGRVPLLERQAFADLLSGVKMSVEACRALTWKAAHVMEHGPGDYDARRELALAAKVYCSDASVKAIMDTINAVGITAYDTEQPFARLLSDAVALPIFDGGNVGVRRRHLQQLMLSPTYDPWAATYGPLQ